MNTFIAVLMLAAVSAANNDMDEMEAAAICFEGKTNIINKIYFNHTVIINQGYKAE